MDQTDNCNSRDASVTEKHQVDTTWNDEGGFKDYGGRKSGKENHISWDILLFIEFKQVLLTLLTASWSNQPPHHS